MDDAEGCSWLDASDVQESVETEVVASSLHNAESTFRPPAAVSLIRLASSDSGWMVECGSTPDCPAIIAQEPPPASDSIDVAPPSDPSSPLEHSRLARRWLKGMATNSGCEGETPSMLDLAVLVNSPDERSPTSVVVPWDNRVPDQTQSAVSFS